MAASSPDAHAGDDDLGYRATPLWRTQLTEEAGTAADVDVAGRAGGLGLRGVEGRTNFDRCPLWCPVCGVCTTLVRRVVGGGVAKTNHEAPAMMHV